MSKFHLAYFKKRNAFTLIEIIVVLIILGVLAAIAIPSYFNMVERTNAAEAMADLKNCKDKIDACIAAKDVATCAGSNNYSEICSSQKFFLENFRSGIHYYIIATRHDGSGDGNAMPNDPGGFWSCDWNNADLGVASLQLPQSGFILCHDGDGTVTIKGWGFYQGM